ncbi:MAG: hypothetical protein ACOCQD_00005, partial [archaeon]
MGILLPLVSTTSNIQNNLNATTEPTENDDITKGYEVGSVWYNISTDESYTCTDNSEGTADWVK